MQLRTSIVAVSMALSGLAYAATPDATLTKELATQLQVHYAVVTNGLPAAQCGPLGADWASCYSANVTLTNSGPALNGKHWEIYFSSIRRILKLDTDQFTVTHLTGDLYRLQPTDKFQGFGAHASLTIPMTLEYWQISESDTMPRWFVRAGDAPAQIIANTNTEDLSQFVAPLGDNWKRTTDDANVLMNATNRYALYSQTPTLPAQASAARIIPAPLTQQLTGGEVTIAHGLQLKTSGLDKTSVAALEQRMAQLGVKGGGKAFPVSVKIDPAAVPEAARKAEGYALTITPQGATINGYDKAGAFYGVQSLLSLMQVSSTTTVPAMTVADAPRFDYRGYMVDIARNFHSKDAILRAIDQMAAYKLNKLHMHLSDDEGWRLQIPGLPELTDVGAKRCLDPSETRCLLPQLGQGPNTDTNGSGYLTRQDFVDILKYAQARQIDVIPEFDMPGHSRAAVVSMEARYKKLMAEGKTDAANEYRLVDPADTSYINTVQYYNRLSTLNPCLPSTLRFADKVMGEVAGMYKQAGVPLTTWHFGGDEAKNIFLDAGYAEQGGKETDGKGQVPAAHRDRPWAKSPVCQALVQAGKVEGMEHLPDYFATQVSALLPKYGIGNFQAWQDGLKNLPNAKSLSTPTRVNFWDTLYWGGADSAAKWSAKGYGVVISNPDYVYIDFPNEIDPKESGYYWGARSNPVKKIFTFAPENLPQNAETSVDRDGNAFEIKSGETAPRITGLSAQMWSEAIRTDAKMEYMIYPRMIAVAERAWHKAAWELPYQAGTTFKHGVTQHVDSKALNQDYAVFANALGEREIAKLDKAGVAYRLPMVGARVVDGKLSALAEFPGVPVQYSLDNGKSWQRYDAAHAPAVSDAAQVQVRTASPDGKRFGRASGLN
ncbi:family 20 glycosylhydrolase [Silvimonas iriomotensis]|uniref:beta-N-acetylhexosaminidase n=1 Tax=Silvimonas iriomotensis TaxID=449662 RepID=A0ABQ2P7R5_9NEIS|nr:family 20 glycosylhydrolase [Silvimonas iriomotensis]GGP20039.1 beta-N-acetylhexosaminidase [Silvimonas iriomotensis]